MIFNSIEFVLFFLIVTTLYFALPYRHRWWLLLLSSCYFYMAFIPVYILILGFTIIIDYYAGIFLEEQTGHRRKFFLIASLIANVGILAIFKYYNFINDSITTLFSYWDQSNSIPTLKILLPIGLSFHTFQAMSYTIEVYRGNQKAERNFGIYALYVMFYPQLVAGPIERPQNILHQFYEKHDLNYSDVSEGLKRILWGVFKKLVIADRLSIYVDFVYANPEHHTGVTLLVATLFFTFQIYCDFSGYSDIAIGTAKSHGLPTDGKLSTAILRRKCFSVLGPLEHFIIDLVSRLPLFSLGGNRTSVPRWYFNVFIVFLLSGLWHGANWTYVIWGALHSIYLIGALVRQQLVKRWSIQLPFSSPSILSRTLAVLTTFALISFSLIFFRANYVSDAFLIVGKIASLKGPLFIKNPSVFVYSLMGIVFLFLYEAKNEYYKGSFSLLHNPNWIVRQVSYATLILLILLIGVFDGGQFIYFQF